MRININQSANWIVQNIADSWYKLFFIGVCVLVVGAVTELTKLHFYSGSETIAFSRSGSLLVAIAIFFVYINHVVRDLVKVNSIFIEQWDKPHQLLKSNLERHARKSIVKMMGEELLRKTTETNPDFLKTSVEALIKSDTSKQLPTKDIEQQLSDALKKKLGEDMLQTSLEKTPDLITKSAETSATSIGNDVLTKKEEVEKYQKAQARIALTELAAGLIGTIVWGFGDLVF